MYGQCYGHLLTADANQNSFLSNTEFADAVRRVSYNAVNVQYIDLPPSLIAAFTTNSQGASGIPIPGTSLGIAPTSALDDLCEDIYTGILTALSVTVSFQKCFLFLSIGDQGRDETLSRAEYPRYVNSASENEYGIVPFNSLPTPVQLVFEDFVESSSDTINIRGTRPGTQPTAEQEPFLQSLCRQTYVAIEAEEGGTEPPPTVDPPGNDYDFTFQFCTTAMAASDINRDSQLNEADYARFVNIVSGNEYPERQFDLLPDFLQQNFIANANSLAYWDIQGSRPGTQPTPAQEANLRGLCDATRDSLNSGGNSGPSTPTLSPTPCEVQTVPLVQCTLSMATSDGDRSNTLAEAEYVSFLNKIQSFKWNGFAYADLPMPLQVNYETLSAASTTPGIDVTGSFPGQAADPAQKAFLEKVCSDTAVAIETALCPRASTPPAPTSSPTIFDPNATPPPTFSGALVVYNAFFIAPIAGTDFDQIFPVDGNTTNRDNLEAAYTELVADVVSGYMTSATRRSTLRYRRRLVVNSLTEGSPDLYQVDNTNCPEGSDASACQIVYGSFEVDVENEPQTLQEKLSSAVQSALIQTQGGLQSYLDRIQPGSPISIIGVPDADSIRPPTPAPTPSQDSRSNDDGGIGTGVLIGIIVGTIVLCCCGYFMYASDTNPLEFLQGLIPSTPQGKRGGKAGSGNDFGSPAMDGEGDEGTTLGGGLGMFETAGGEKEEGGAGFSIQEQSPVKSSRSGVFGFGKRDSPGDNTGSPMHGDNDSVADYSFNDPTLDPSKAGNESMADVSFQGDWNPQKPQATGDPWRDRQRDSSSSSGEDEEEDDDGTGYGDSDSESGSDEDRDDYDDDQEDEDYSDDYDQNTNFGESATFEGDENMASAFDESGDVGTEDFQSMGNDDNWNGEMSGGSQGFGESGDFGASFGASQSPSNRSGSGSRGSRSGTGRSRSSGMTMNTQKREYLERVRELVSLVVPDEVDNVPAMMEQFAGREEELINTLQTMYERSSTSRPRRSVHRSKGIPDEAGRFIAGTAEGTAAVAAASTIGHGFDSMSYASSQQSESYGQSQSYSQQSGSYASQSYGSQSYDSQQEDSYGQGNENIYLDNEDSYLEGDDQEYSDDYTPEEGEEDYDSYQDEQSASYADDDYGQQRQRGEPVYYDDAGEGSYDDNDFSGSYGDEYDDADGDTFGEYQ